MYIFNDKVITLVLGSPGSGKSTFAAKLVRLAEKEGVPIYCNYPVLGAIAVDMKDVIKYDLGRSVLVIDEAGLSFNSRNIKAFTQEHYHWFATTRHRRTQIFVIVQNWGRVDIVLRQLATEIIMCKKGFFGLSTLRVFREEVKLLEDKEGNATEFMEVFFKTRWTMFWRPNYYHMFDSYHLDREYMQPDFAAYPASYFPEMQSFGRRLLEAVLGPRKSRQRRSRKRGGGETPPLLAMNPVEVTTEAAGVGGT